MAPRRKDLFLPAPDMQFSKGEVDRAGQLMRRFFHDPLPVGVRHIDYYDMDTVVEAMFAVTWCKQQHARPLSQAAAALRYHVLEERGKVDNKVDITQRLKKRDTIINKLDRFHNMKLTQMHDIGGVRARLPSLDCLVAVSRRLRKNWKIVKTRDYVVEPKASGYRAIHHDIRKDGKVIEIQLRTVRQDAWANQVEDDGRALGTGYKFGFGDDDIHGYYRAVSEVFWALDSGQAISGEMAAELNLRYDKIRDVLRPNSPRRAS